VNNLHVTACIDGSAISDAVCDSAAWASSILAAPLKFLHVLEKAPTPAQGDLSGTLGIGVHDQLLSELTELDERRNRLAIEHGKLILDAAKKRAEKLGVKDVMVEQRHDKLLDALLSCEKDTRLFVLGRQGADHPVSAPAVGSHIENVVRSVHTPILMATGQFSTPSNYMLAYDGSKTADRAIERIAKSPLLLSLPGHVVMVGSDNNDNRSRLENACRQLLSNGHQVQPHLIQGNVVDALLEFQQQHHIELKVIGAYGHSRIREFIVGSVTTKMLVSSVVPVLVLR